MNHYAYPYAAYGPPNGYNTGYYPPGNAYPGAYPPPPAPAPYPPATLPRRTRRASDSQAPPSQYREAQAQPVRGQPVPAPQTQRSRTVRQSEDLSQNQRARTARQLEEIPRAARPNGYADNYPEKVNGGPPTHPRAARPNGYADNYPEKVNGGPPGYPSPYDYLFVSLSSHDTLKINCITSPQLVTFLEEALSRSWPSAYAETDDPSNSILRLGGDVWGAGGEVGLRARMFVIRLFELLAKVGFGYLTTFNNHPLKAPRLVFTGVEPDPEPSYFMISFSVTRRTVQVINAPSKIAKQISASLRASVSTSSAQADRDIPQRPTERIISSGVLEFTTNAAGGRIDLTQTMPGILRIISLEGWHFEANIAFGKAGLFGMRGRREAWLFRRDGDYYQSQRARARRR